MTLIIRGFLAVGDIAFSDPFANGAGYSQQTPPGECVHVCFSRIQLLPKGTSSPHVV